MGVWAGSRPGQRYLRFLRACWAPLLLVALGAACSDGESVALNPQGDTPSRKVGPRPATTVPTKSEGAGGAARAATPLTPSARQPQPMRTEPPARLPDALEDGAGGSPSSDSDDAER